jgi:hypothetical protein
MNKCQIDAWKISVQLGKEVCLLTSIYAHADIYGCYLRGAAVFVPSPVTCFYPTFENANYT